MTDLTAYGFHGQSVRVITDEHGDPWFVAADVARILGYRDANALVRRVDEEDRGTRILSTPGGDQTVTVVTEPGLYIGVLGSTVPRARAFKRWVTHELLPEVRRTGSYSLPKDYPSALRALAAEAEARAALEAKVHADAPKVLFADAVATSSTDILVGDLAKILRGNDVQVGANRLFEWLRNDGYLIRRQGSDWNMPTQRSMELGLFRVKETAITHSDGHVSVSKTPKVTGKGQAYFVSRYTRAAA